MRQADEIINALSGLGVTIRVQANNLVLTPRSKVPADLIEELRCHKTEIIDLVRQPKVQVCGGQLPPLDRPPETELELRRLMDCLADPVAFSLWFQRLMEKADPAEVEGEEDNDQHIS
jgi:hypothetical protein